MKHVVMFSGGVGSWAAAKRIAERHGTDDLTLLFTDTYMEDSDLYRFLVEGAASIFGVTVPSDLLSELRDIPEYHVDAVARHALLDTLRPRTQTVLPQLAWVAEGRDPWQVFRDTRLLGNSRVDPCSRVLKREVADRYLAEHFDPADTVAYVGIDWTEVHRFAGRPGRPGLRERKAEQGWRYEAPLCEPPLLDRDDLFAQVATAGLEPPKLYQLGFAHNNCSGFCVKAGHAHFAHLYATAPDRYRFYEAQEQAMRDYLNQDVAMLVDRRGGGPRRPLTLAALRQRLDGGEQVDLHDVGGCACFFTPEESAP